MDFNFQENTLRKNDVRIRVKQANQAKKASENYDYTKVGAILL